MTSASTDQLPLYSIGLPDLGSTRILVSGISLESRIDVLRPGAGERVTDSVLHIL